MNISTIDATSLIDILTGLILFFPKSSPPIGWIECNGAALNRDDYPDLYNSVGLTYTSGDDGATFNVPDLRGEFIRCWDNGRGVDKYPTYTYGGSTTESNRQFDSNVQSYATKTIIGSMYKISETFANYGSANGPMWRSGGYYAGNTPNHVDSSGTGSFEFNSSRVSNSSLGETRPRNIALLACIKY
jgi:microcystin-dependent protein